MPDLHVEVLTGRLVGLEPAEFGRLGLVQGGSLVQFLGEGVLDAPDGRLVQGGQHALRNVG